MWQTPSIFCCNMFTFMEKRQSKSQKKAFLAEMKRQVHSHHLHVTLSELGKETETQLSVF